MSYACPVCDAPQADDEHLANHLAITGLLHGGEHAAWLDERVDGWADRSPEALADDVVEFAEPIDDAGATDGRPRGRPPTLDGALARRSGAGRASSEAVEAVLEEARELTEQMRESDAGAE